MIIKELKLINHRNYRNEDVAFHDKVNILVGKNAQGKTNLLEAIYICARGYSFKNLKEDKLILFGQNQSYLKALIFNNDRKRSVEVKFSDDDKKRIRINEVEISNLSDLSSQFGVVLFSPEELKIVKETPKLRRDFLDDLISNNDISYRKNLLNYNKIRSQKNELLKNSSQSKYFTSLLNALNEKLVEYGSIVAIYRYRYIEILKNFAKKYHKMLTKDEEDLDIIYSNNYSDVFESLDCIKAEFSSKLDENIDREMGQYTSLIGPHKDDLIFYINGLDVKSFASQGQQRTLMLSLRLGEAKLIETVTKAKPILLLDDVFSELDNSRASMLVKAVKEYQTIITTNSMTNIDIKDMDGNVYTIKAGSLSVRH